MVISPLVIGTGSGGKDEDRADSCRYDQHPDSTEFYFHGNLLLVEFTKRPSVEDELIMPV
jgi:hypothetical protein